MLLKLAAAAAFAVIGLAGAANANAQSLCDNHGAGPGQIYKTACAAGGGGGGSMTDYFDKDGKRHPISEHDLHSVAD